MVKDRTFLGLGLENIELAFIPILVISFMTCTMVYYQFRSNGTLGKYSCVLLFIFEYCWNISHIDYDSSRKYRHICPATHINRRCINNIMRNALGPNWKAIKYYILTKRDQYLTPCTKIKDNHSKILLYATEIRHHAEDKAIILGT